MRYEAYRGDGDRSAHTATERADGKINLWAQIHEDWVSHDGSWARPGLHAVIVHRLGSRVRSMETPWRLPLWLFYGMLYFIVRNVYGIELPAGTVIGRRLRIAHQSGIVVNEAAVIGDDCLLRHNVTIGASSDDRAADAPVIGNGVQVGPGAVIMGPITIGDGARIGPNALVIHDVPADGRVLAPIASVRGLQAPLIS